MKLQFVGCGDAFGSGGRFNTCFQLTGSGVNALIDCGATSMVAMNRLDIDRNRIDFIFLTHFHLDHIGAVPPFLLEAHYVLKRDRPLTIVGPPGLKARLTGLMEASFPGTADLAWHFPLQFAELEIGKSTDFGAVKATAFHVKHDDRAGPCLGYRLEADGKVFAYSGDTEWTDAVIEIGRGADLFVCEAYTRDKPIATHMAYSALEQHIDQIRPKRLVLTHMSDEMLARRSEVQVNTATDGMIIDF